MINIRYPPWTICIIYIINFIFNFAWPLATKLQRKSWTCVVHNVFFSTVSKITLLSSLESSFRNTWKHLPLLVKIIHKSRLRYYGKFGLKIDFPFQVSLNFGRILRLSKNKMWRGSYLLDVLHIFNRFVVIECNIIWGFFTSCFVLFQAYFEVADQSGTMSLVLWNELCPEFYQKLSVGTVLYIQNYTLKQSYSNRSHPQMDHHRMKTFNSVGTYRTSDYSLVF